MEVLYYLKNQSIDKKQWDKIIANSINGNFYAYSWFLDLVYDDWDALVNKDYSMVMPIPFFSVEQKDSVVVSKFTSRLGIFSDKELSSEVVTSFLNGIPENITKLVYPLNKYNPLRNNAWQGGEFSIYELDLFRSYTDTSKSFSNFIKTQNAKARAKKISVNQHVNMNEFIQLFINDQFKQGNFLKENDTNRLKRIVSRLLHKRKAEIYGAFNEMNEMISAAFFVWSNRKVCLYLLAQNEEVSNDFGLIRIIDRYIENHSEKNLTLTFESFSNSSPELYEGFGAKQCELFEIRMDKRSWIKKIFNYG